MPRFLPPIIGGQQKAYHGFRARPRTTPVNSGLMGWAGVAQSERVDVGTSAMLYWEGIVGRKFDHDHRYCDPGNSTADGTHMSWANAAANIGGWTPDISSSRSVIPFIGFSTRWANAIAQVNAGQWDAWIDNLFIFLSGIATNPRWGDNRLFFAWNHEWDTYHNDFGGTADDYIGSWRRVVTRARAVGATNIAFCNVQQAAAFGNGSATATYPGDDVIDWILADGYPMNNGRDYAATGPLTSAPTTFKTVYDKVITWSNAGHTQAGTHGGTGYDPASKRGFGNGEWGCGDYEVASGSGLTPANKGKWFFGDPGGKDASSTINSSAYDKFMMYTYFNSNAVDATGTKKDYWEIDTKDGSDPHGWGSQAAYVSLAGTSRFNLTAAVALTIASGSNNVLLSNVGSTVTTIFVSDGTQLPAASAGAPQTISVTLQTGLTAIIQYTGISGNSITGCTLVTGTGTLHTNDPVQANGLGSVPGSSSIRLGTFV